MPQWRLHRNAEAAVERQLHPLQHPGGAEVRAAAVDLIDEFLSDIAHQSLVDGDKVRDFVLDLRIALTMPSRLTVEDIVPGGAL